MTLNKIIEFERDVDVYFDNEFVVIMVDNKQAILSGEEALELVSELEKKIFDSKLNYVDLEREYYKLKLMYNDLIDDNLRKAI